MKRNLTALLLTAALLLALTACGKKASTAEADAMPAAEEEETAADVVETEKTEEQETEPFVGPVAEADVDGEFENSASEAEPVEPAAVPEAEKDSTMPSTETENIASGSTSGTNTESSSDTGSSSARPSGSEQSSGSGSTGGSDISASGSDAEQGGKSYESFLAMTPAEQDAFMQSFESPAAFTEWLLAAQAEYEASHPTEEIGADGVIHIGS